MGLVLRCFALTLAFSAVAHAFDADHIPFETDPKVWKLLSDTKGVKTYQERSSESDVIAFRGETIIPTTIERIATVLRDQNIRKEWVDALVETKTLEQTSPLDLIEYNHTSVPWPFQDRDFVYRAKVKVDSSSERSLLIYMTSIDTPLQPEKKGIVRGQVLHAFYYMKAVPGADPQTKIMIELALDPKGAIPLWIVNLTQKRWPTNTLVALKRLATKPDLVVPKEVKDYFAPIAGVHE